MNQMDIFTGASERESYIVSDIVISGEIVLRCKTTPLSGPVANDEIPPWL